MVFGFNFFKGRKEKEYFHAPIGLYTKNGNQTHDETVINIINITYDDFLKNKDPIKQQKINLQKEKIENEENKSPVDKAIDIYALILLNMNQKDYWPFQDQKIKNNLHKDSVEALTKLYASYLGPLNPSDIEYRKNFINQLFRTSKYFKSLEVLSGKPKFRAPSLPSYHTSVVDNEKAKQIGTQNPINAKTAVASAELVFAPPKTISTRPPTTLTRGGKTKRKVSKINKKDVLGKQRNVYKFVGDKKEYIKYKNEYVLLKKYKEMQKTKTKPKTKTKTKPKTKTKSKK
jgi:hypothetical protein